MVAALVCFGILCLSTAVVCVLDDSEPELFPWDATDE